MSKSLDELKLKLAEPYSDHFIAGWDAAVAELASRGPEFDEKAAYKEGQIDYDDISATVFKDGARWQHSQTAALLAARTVAAEDMNEKHVAEIEKLRQDLAEAKARIAERDRLESEVLRLKPAVNAAAESIVRYIEEIDELRAQLAEAKAEVERLSAENVVIQQKLSAESVMLAEANKAAERCMVEMTKEHNEYEKLTRKLEADLADATAALAMILDNDAFLNSEEKYFHNFVDKIARPALAKLRGRGES